ncbi:MAG: DUF535 domain-containing protein [Selenomonadaceae bacterium]|nr:DUF535 domain-containing protein [Selenomonadaceae bacterium]
MINFVELGKKIYRLENPREAHRFAVFVARCCLHPKSMERVENFFAQDELLSAIAEKFPFVYEQVTRAFFYHRSTFDERIKLVEEHFEFMTRTLSREFLLRLYGDEKILLWSMPVDETLGELRLMLWMNEGQRKEGLASVILMLSRGSPVYQIMFWVARDAAGDFSMWIGAMQGPNVDDARELIKTLTKKCHAYRTKNLILYAAQAVARALGLKKIYAVTNAGYYANNHIRVDRKLKTSFSDFWLECGGAPTDDERFFSLPLSETRKTVEEIPSHKRAVYRKRFALLDEIDAAVADKIQAFRRGD